MKLEFLLHLRCERNLTEYWDGRLAPAERRQIEDHLSTCDSCTRRLAELRSVRDALQWLRRGIETGGDSPLPPWSTIAARFASPPAPVPFFLHYRLPLAGAASLLLVLALAFVLYSPTSQPPAQMATARMGASDLYQFVGDHLLAPENVLMGEPVMIGPEAEEAIFPDRSYFHERSVL